MKQTVPPMEQNGYILRLSQEQDLEEYYRQGFAQDDAEITRLTGSHEHYPYEEVAAHFKRCLTDENRYDFLILSPEGKIIGESVINEIDWDVRSANFRIAMFHSRDCGKGVGSWATQMTRDFAFEKLKLHRLSLTVFSFNPRAQKAYAKAGFKIEGVLRDAVLDGNSYADDIFMAMLEDEWRAIKGNL